MKKFTAILSVFTIISLLGFNANAQSYKILGQNKINIAVAYVGQGADYTFWVKNTSGSDTLRIDWTVIKNNLPSSWSPQLCDNHSCYASTFLPSMGHSATTDAFKNKDSASFAFSTVPTENLAKPSTFTVLTSVHNGTGAPDTLTVVIEQVETGIDEAKYGNIKLDIYPNPASDKLYINAENLKSGSIDIYTLEGKKLQTIATGAGMQSMDIQNYTPGIYMIRYQDKAGNFGIRKFIKE